MMSKATGFLEYTRKETDHRSVSDRINDWNEFLQPVDQELIHTQSARCMDCGVPFCQAGMLAAGSSIGCPLKNLVPETNDLVYRGDYETAFRRLSKTHPFPEITSRVCPALCEGSCTLGEHDQPVTVKSIERFLSDYAADNGWIKAHKTKPSTGKKVAVIGGGPSGLACADALSRQGHEVTVYERADRPGGFLMYGIPGMKLDKKIVQNRVKILEQQGISFVCSFGVEDAAAAAKLLREYDATVLCVGARKNRLPDIQGMDAKGVYTAVEYLSANTRRLLNDEMVADYINAEGKDVVILGGGDTGTDCIATAIRQKAKSVTALEIMPVLPQKRAENNPWPLWPRVQKTDYGHEEAIETFGHDVREYETTAKEIVTKDGTVSGIKTVKVSWEKNTDGRLFPKELPETEIIRPADLVLTAMGFTGTEADLPKALGLPLNARGVIQTEQTGTYQTSLPGVFAAGDARRGPSLVVWAIMEGMQAAKECHQYLEK